VLGSQSIGSHGSDDDVNRETDEIGREGRKAIASPLRISVSMLMFSPSTHPRSRRPCRNASCQRAVSAGENGERSPSRGTFAGCCAWDAVRREEEAEREDDHEPDCAPLRGGLLRAAPPCPSTRRMQRRMSTRDARLPTMNVVLSRTLRVRRCRKRERGTSGRWRQSPARGC